MDSFVFASRNRYVALSSSSSSSSSSTMVKQSSSTMVKQSSSTMVKQPSLYKILRWIKKRVLCMASYHDGGNHRPEHRRWFYLSSIIYGLYCVCVIIYPLLSSSMVVFVCICRLCSFTSCALYLSYAFRCYFIIVPTDVSPQIILVGGLNPSEKY